MNQTQVKKNIPWLIDAKGITR